MHTEAPFPYARVLVTGGGGFLGRHVLAELAARAPAAAVFAPRAREYDLTDARRADALLAAVKPDLVLHLAARVGGIGANAAHPGGFLRDNLAMGLAVLDAARRTPSVAKLVLVGTVCAYPKHAPVPFREDGLWDGFPEETNAPYGVAKRALGVMADAYRAEYGCNFVTAVPVNLYGPGDHFDPATSHVIPALVRRFVEAAAAGDPAVTLWGDGTPTREFLYVGDAARGLLDVAARYDAPAPLNLGTGVEVAIADLAAAVARACGYAGRIAWDPSRPNGQPRRCLDTARARAAIGWAPRVAFADGLARTVAWYRAERAIEGG